MSSWGYLHRGHSVRAAAKRDLCCIRGVSDFPSTTTLAQLAPWELHTAYTPPPAGIHPCHERKGTCGIIIPCEKGRAPRIEIPVVCVPCPHDAVVCVHQALDCLLALLESFIISLSRRRRSFCSLCSVAGPTLSLCRGVRSSVCWCVDPCRQGRREGGSSLATSGGSHI